MCPCKLHLLPSPMLLYPTCRHANETMSKALLNWVTKPIYVALHCLEFVACLHFLLRLGIVSWCSIGRRKFSSFFLWSSQYIFLISATLPKLVHKNMIGICVIWLQWIFTLCFQRVAFNNHSFAVSELFAKCRDLRHRKEFVYLREYKHCTTVSAHTALLCTIHWVAVISSYKEQIKPFYHKVRPFFFLDHEYGQNNLKFPIELRLFLPLWS